MAEIADFCIMKFANNAKRPEQLAWLEEKTPFTEYDAGVYVYKEQQIYEDHCEVRFT